MCLILQLYARQIIGQIVVQHDHAMPVRSYAKEAAPSGLPPLKGDGSILILSYFLVYHSFQDYHYQSCNVGYFLVTKFHIIAVL